MTHAAAKQLGTEFPTIQRHDIDQDQERLQRGIEPNGSARVHGRRLDTSVARETRSTAELRKPRLDGALPALSSRIALDIIRSR